MGGAGGAAEGHQVDPDEIPAPDPASADQPDHVGLVPASAAELQRRRLPDQQKPHGSRLQLQPRRADRSDGRPAGSAIRSARDGHPATVPYGQAGQGLRRRSGGPGRIRLALRNSRPRRLHRRRTGPGPCRGQVRRRPAPDRRPHRRLPHVHPGPCRGSPQTGRDLPLWGDHRRPCPGPHPDRRRRQHGWPRGCRPLRLRPRPLRADCPEIRRHQGADLSDQGVFHHPARHRFGRRPPIDHHGRNP